MWRILCGVQEALGTAGAQALATAAAPPAPRVGAAAPAEAPRNWRGGAVPVGVGAGVQARGVVAVAEGWS